MDKISLFPDFQSILRLGFVSYACFTVSYGCIGHYAANVDIINRQFGQLFCQEVEFAINILHPNIVYLKAPADLKISTFFGDKWWVEAVDHEMDL